MQLTDALVDVARTVGERPEVEGPVRQELLRLADALAEHGPVDAAEIATVDRSLRELTECEVEQKPAPEVAQPSGAEVARLVATEFAVTGASRAEVAEAIRPLIPAGEIRAMVDSVLPRGSRRVGAA